MRRFKVPCAGCSKKFYADQLKPAFHGAFESKSWYIDKRCEKCIAIHLNSKGE